MNKSYMTALATIIAYAASIPDLLSDDYKFRQRLVDLVSTGTILLADDQGGGEVDDIKAKTLCEELAGLISLIREDGYTLPVADHESDWTTLRSDAHVLTRNLIDMEVQMVEARKPLAEKIAMLTGIWERQNAELLKEASDLAAKAADQDASLRAEMLVAFVVNGDKQIDTGLSVRCNASYEFEDSDAVNFAIERKMMELVKPDKTAFGKQMKLTPQPWATKVQTASTVVSFKDLEGK